MLQLLLHFLLITICCFLWGVPLWYFGNKKNIRITFSFSDFLLSLFAGLAIISVLAAWASLFLPVQYHLLLFLTAPLLGWFLYSGRQRLKIDPALLRSITIPEWVFLSTIFLLLLFLGTGKPQMEDTDL